MSKSTKKYNNTAGLPCAKIREVIQKCDLGIVEAAKELKVDRNTLSKYMSGDSVPKADFYVRLVKLAREKRPELYVNYEYLLEEDNDNITKLDPRTAENLGLTAESIDNIKKLKRLGKRNLVTKDKKYKDLDMLNKVLSSSFFIDLLKRLSDLRKQNLDNEFTQWQLEKSVKEFAVAIINQLK